MTTWYLFLKGKDGSAYENQSMSYATFTELTASVKKKHTAISFNAHKALEMIYSLS